MVADKLSRIHLQNLGLYSPNDSTDEGHKPGKPNTAVTIEEIMEDCEEIKANFTDIQLHDTKHTANTNSSTTAGTTFLQQTSDNNSRSTCVSTNDPATLPCPNNRFPRYTQ